MTTILKAFNNFTFGCDPELFIKDAKGNLVSAAGLIPGTKENPHPVDCGAVQVDGMAAEFNIDAASTFEQFDNNIETVMAALKAMLPKGYSFCIEPHVRFPKEVFEAAPDEAKELGCTPDFNAWTGSVNPPPNAPDDPYLRTASGHIHIGWSKKGDEPFSPSNEQHILNCCDMVKQLDWFLGAWSLLHDPDPVRRKLYGKAGAYRPKPYGVEYRVLSNFWIKTRELRLEVWNRLQKAAENMAQRFYPEYVSPNQNQELISSINTGQLNAYIRAAYTFPIVDLRLEGSRAKKGSFLSDYATLAQATMAPMTPPISPATWGDIG